MPTFSRTSVIVIAVTAIAVVSFVLIRSGAASTPAKSPSDQKEEQRESQERGTLESTGEGKPQNFSKAEEEQETKANYAPLQRSALDKKDVKGETTDYEVAEDVEEKVRDSAEQSTDCEQEIQENKGLAASKKAKPVFEESMKVEDFVKSEIPPSSDKSTTDAEKADVVEKEVVVEAATEKQVHLGGKTLNKIDSPTGVDLSNEATDDEVDKDPEQEDIDKDSVPPTVDSKTEETESGVTSVAGKIDDPPLDHQTSLPKDDTDKGPVQETVDEVAEKQEIGADNSSRQESADHVNQALVASPNQPRADSNVPSGNGSKLTETFEFVPDASKEGEAAVVVENENGLSDEAGVTPKKKRHRNRRRKGKHAANATPASSPTPTTPSADATEGAANVAAVLKSKTKKKTKTPTKKSNAASLAVRELQSSQSTGKKKNRRKNRK